MLPRRRRLKYLKKNQNLPLILHSPCYSYRKYLKNTSGQLCSDICTVDITNASTQNFPLSLPLFSSPSLPLSVSPSLRHIYLFEHQGYRKRSRDKAQVLFRLLIHLLNSCASLGCVRCQELHLGLVHEWQGFR